MQNRYSMFLYQTTFKKSALLRQNSHTIYFTHLKAYNSMAFNIFTVGQPSSESILEYFNHPKKKPDIP
jgi:hypothetical protein